MSDPTDRDAIYFQYVIASTAYLLPSSYTIGDKRLRFRAYCVKFDHRFSIRPIREELTLLRHDAAIATEAFKYVTASQHFLVL